MTEIDRRDEERDDDERPEGYERPGGLLSKVDGHLVMYHDPRGVHAEQYRSCRTNLTAMNRAGAPWSIVVTSSKKGEGKSVTVANLAMCLAELPGTRVCLLDTDFRAPSQAKIFGVESEAGVTELILDQVAYKDVLHHTVIPNLDLIPSGDEPDSPAELLGSDRFVNLMEELKRRYSWILVDTPPVNPYTDACILSSMTNGVLVVVRLQETPRELVNRSLESIRSAGGRVIGTFLTGTVTERDDADRAGYYRVDAGDRESVRDEAARRKARQRAEKRLQQQERAFLRKRKKEQRTDEHEEESPV